MKLGHYEGSKRSKGGLMVILLCLLVTRGPVGGWGGETFEVKKVSGVMYLKIMNIFGR